MAVVAPLPLLHEPITRSLRDVDLRLGMARRMTEAWICASARCHAPLIDPATVADSWRQTCGAILIAHQALENALEGACSNAEIEKDTRTINQLTEAMDGGLPCCDSQGRISIPGWAERRTAERIQCDVPASIGVCDRVIDGKIVNISRTGVGLVCAGGIETGNNIDVWVAGRTVAATVRWARHGVFGARWHQPLRSDDQLLIASRALGTM